MLERILDERAAFLFDEALQNTVPPRFWFDHAKARGVDVSARLRECVADSSVPLEQAETAVLLLLELKEPWAVELLRVAARQPRLRERAESALESKGALERVEQAQKEAVDRSRARRTETGGLRPVGARG